ncbi:TorD/DmsD family molecular chaperone [Natronobacterium gregoryi]|uniref:Dehydrogenase n=2 Tax=Natronobacterium gregoryi TaxID=44930 RepID=L0AF45_NATGS|nr:molecular chaperone TorD family protein [Natronobacterium gregoryi]AFZ71665.1 putative component of anaerobic dehydrogenase [Natronobacterium gregoryi SP2]ELY72762.1 anaerobic dehydrogenase subunit [Natronobacterium gregoryi SP2]PLK20285.1 dehydrogenase [Natronobacterium gregoryi SP2]SFJ24606.1 chaperone TorD involved in molybdoenzyme TorA maturation [Natronobacterium gregoryi]
MTDTESERGTVVSDSPGTNDEDAVIENERETLAALYEFAAGALADPLDSDAVERIADAGLPEPEAVPNEHLQRGFDLLASWRRTVDDPEEVAHDLERVHTRLFVGPQPKLQIHESYYADDFLGEPLARVRGTYMELGIEPAPDLREEADHAAVELAALAVLTHRESADPAEKTWFLREHGWWFDAFAADVDDAATSEFYRAVGAIAAGLVQFDANRHDVELECDQYDFGFEESTDHA